jgi:urea transport system substrate-binding protein
MIAAASVHKRILLVEDNFLTREALSMILATEGYRVTLAANGAEALQRLHGPERPDLILLDLGMPVMDGLRFCCETKQHGELAGIPVVIFSAAEDADQKAADVGAVGCLHKPVETPQLLDLIRKVVSGQSSAVSQNQVRSTCAGEA